jgi:single-stranded DNA-binding protein
VRETTKQEIQMRDQNEHIGSGRLGVEPKIFTGECGRKVGKLFALLNDSYTGKGGNEHKSTLPVNIVLLRPDDVATAENLHIGDAVSWEGKLARRTYEKDGKEQAVFEILVVGKDSKLEVLDAKQAAGVRPSQGVTASPAA